MALFNTIFISQWWSIFGPLCSADQQPFQLINVTWHF